MNPIGSFLLKGIPSGKKVLTRPDSRSIFRTSRPELICDLSRSIVPAHMFAQLPMKAEAEENRLARSELETLKRLHCRVSMSIRVY